MKGGSFQRLCPKCGKRHFAGTACADLPSTSPFPRRKRIARRAAAEKQSLTPTDPAPPPRRSGVKRSARGQAEARSSSVTLPSQAKAAVRQRLHDVLPEMGKTHVERRGEFSPQTKRCRECLKTKPMSAFPNPRRSKCDDCGGQPPSRSIRTVSGGAPGLGRRQ